jgi:hypothetical protein
MASSRNVRRKAAKARLAAKSKRIADASEAARLQQQRAIVAANKRQPIDRVELMAARAMASPLGRAPTGNHAHVFGSRVKPGGKESERYLLELRARERA